MADDRKEARAYAKRQDKRARRSIERAGDPFNDPGSALGDQRWLDCSSGLVESGVVVQISLTRDKTALKIHLYEDGEAYDFYAKSDGELFELADHLSKEFL